MFKYITILIGLPGSGKTHYIREHRKISSVIFDDVTVNDPQFKNLKQCNSQIIMVSDPTFVYGTRESIELFFRNKIFPDQKLTFIFKYFENDLIKCWNNVKLRNDGREINWHIMKHMSLNYKIPDNVTPIEVIDWSKENVHDRKGQDS